MSSGLECAFVEREAGKWYYVLQNYSCPAGGDWLDDCTAYGPFGTEEAALSHLDDNHSNPGGWSTYRQGDEWTDRILRIGPLNEALDRAIDPARSTRARVGDVSEQRRALRRAILDADRYR